MVAPRPAPSEVPSWLAPLWNGIRRTAGRSDDQACWADDRFRFEIPAGDLTHEQLRRPRAEVASVHGNARQSREGIFGFFDIVEADDREVSSDRDARLHQRAYKADRHDVVEAKSSGRGLREDQEARGRRSAPRVVGRRFDNQSFIERNSGLLEGEAIARQPLVANNQRIPAADESDPPMPVFDQMGGRLTCALSVLGCN